MISTVQAEERIVAERAERQRLESAAEQRTRAIDLFQRNKQTIDAMMIQFDTLMSEGVYNVLYNGGMGDIRAATQPFYEARLLAQKAYALQRGGPLPYSDNDPAPAAGEFVSNAMSFYTQEIAVPQAQAVPVPAHDAGRHPRLGPLPRQPDIEYPDADWWRYISEKRIKRWGKAVDLFDRDPKTKQILEKLDEPISHVVRQRDAARRRPQVHQAGDHDADLHRHPDLRRSDRASRKPSDRMTSTVATSTSKACPSRSPSS